MKSSNKAQNHFPSISNGGVPPELKAQNKFQELEKALSRAQKKSEKSFMNEIASSSPIWLSVLPTRQSIILYG